MPCGIPLGLMREPYAHKTKIKIGSLMRIRPCARHSSKKHLMQSYALPGFTAQSLMRVLCGFFLDSFFIQYNTVYIYQKKVGVYTVREYTYIYIGNMNIW